MSIQTFRAKTMRDALAEVRRALGADAAVLHTRELNTGLIARLIHGPCIEVAARAGLPPSASVPPPPSEPKIEPESDFPLFASEHEATRRRAETHGVDSRLNDIQSMVDSLREGSPRSDAEAIDAPLPDPLFRAFTDLLEADVNDQVAREMIEQTRRDLPPPALTEPVLVEERLAAAAAERLPTRGPIELTQGATRVVALVGPTGVGKTTTIAKLAANYRIRERRSVGLITVDTYRVAAVEQLRTYADIIDLPMEVVATPREMRAAVERLRSCDIVLIDTAGRSPRDEVRLQELRAMLGEASPDETHLVLSATTTRRGLLESVRRFTPVGVDALLLTKLDEAATLGGILGVGERDGAPPLPIGYLTDGQNVPDDIRVADRDRFARAALKPEAE